MRNEGTHIQSEKETVANNIHRFFSKLKGKAFTYWNSKKFGKVGKGFHAPHRIHVVNGRNITLGENVFIGLHSQIYAQPTGEVTIGDNVSIDRFVEIRGGAKTEIKNNVRIVKFTTIKAAQDSVISIGSRTLISQGCIFDGDIRIGDDVIFGPSVFINEVDHGFQRRDIPMNKQSGNQGTIVIEDDVWLGYNSVLLKGVRIANGSIIGANAVVNRSVPPFSINVGVPARVQRFRDE